MSILKNIKEKQLAPLILATIFLVVLGILMLILWKSGVFSLLRDVEALEAYIDRTGGIGILYLFLFQVLVVLFVPFAGAVPAIAGGVIYGFWTSFLVCSLGLVLASCINYALARYFGRPFVEYFCKKETIDKYLDSFDERKKTLLFLMFFFPGFPDTLLCFIAGLTDIKWRFFLIAVILGRPWGLIISSLIGSGVFSVPIWGYLIFALFVIIVLVFAYKFGNRINSAIQRKILKKFAVIRFKK